MRCPASTYACPAASPAQELNLIGRTNLGFGIENHSIDYGGSTIPYSGGDGFGLELGLQWEFIENLMLQSTVGFDVMANFQSESTNGYSNTSSVAFGETFITAGLAKKFKLGDDLLNGFLVGGGLSYNFPGNLSRTENEKSLGTISYDPNIGFYLDIPLRLKLSKTLYLDPNIRYAGVNYTANSFSGSEPEYFPSELKNLNASSIQLGATLAIQLKAD